MAAERRPISILGVTGSIGGSTVDLVRREPERWRVVALSAGTNVAALAEAARLLRPEVAVVADPAGYADLAAALAGTGIEVGAGPSAVCDAARRPTEVLVSAIVGAAGLAPSLAALEGTRVLALANKETLVAAGSLVMAQAERRGVAVLPVDSEHNAIFQILDRRHVAAVTEVCLTASGGPFRTLPAADFATITPAMALRHPNWTMGRKITIDSATLMNKGLELIEAAHLFPVGPDKLTVLVHPQSVVHGLVRYADGALLAELGAPDMRTAIGYCLSWPERRATPVAPLDLARLGSLTFEAPDRGRFPCLALAEAALRRGSGAPCVLNAANEVAVEAFLDGRIPFTGIAALVDAALAAAEGRGLLLEPDSLGAAEELDRAARRLALAALPV